ncbi:MAG: hypothetical protein OXD47_11965 [Gammaproteobacteria bacterium]|nr:hypothetical protein [Gammaproteobacteria bacterium]MCY4339486.1 hypothetical protein [Gammaproteobacteria bacterium]
MDNQFGIIGCALVNNIKPVILSQPFCGFVFIFRERYVPGEGATFDLDEADIDERFCIFGVGLAGFQVVTQVL